MSQPDTRPRLHRKRRTVLARACGVVVAGCSGDENRERSFSAADAKRIANVQPEAPGWTWPRAPERPAESSASGESDPDDPLLVELKNAMADVDGLGEASNKWRDRDKLGNLVVGAFASASDADKAMAASNAFSRGWGKRLGDVTEDERSTVLGDAAWHLSVVANGTQVTYHWRRDNLVFEVHVHCFGTCPGNVDVAARAWADAVDDEARRSS